LLPPENKQPDNNSLCDKKQRENQKQHTPQRKHTMKTTVISIRDFNKKANNLVNKNMNRKQVANVRMSLLYRELRNSVKGN
jgi:hypothetical protein